jgi:deoxyribose-phosphate aldolase
VAAIIDHTLLAPEATAEAVARLCVEAGALGVKAVCVSASRLPLAGAALRPGIEVAAVVGFPSGAHPVLVKAAEAAAVVALGATEVDVVIDLGLATAGDWSAITGELSAVRAAVGPSVLIKAILETALIGALAIPDACWAAEAAGVDFVKTSTGFHPAGGASPEAVALMARTVGGRLGVKASGGIRTTETALRMIDAGATRIGASASAKILSGLDP